MTIVPVDVNSVHDKLLTNFVGGTAADVIHDEAADIAELHSQQGYLANLSPLISKRFKASIPQSLWDTVNFGRNRVTASRSSCRRTTSSRTWTSSSRRASRRRPRRPVDVDAVPRREAAHELEPLRRLLGPPLADDGDPDDVAQLRRQYFLEGGKWNRWRPLDEQASSGTSTT